MRDQQPGYNIPTVVADPTITVYQDTRLLHSAGIQRDALTARYQGTATGHNRSLWIVRQLENGTQIETQIQPHPFIDRVGTKSRPYRLLSGKEIQLSEDDFRVNGVSKRYTLSDLFGWGVLYILDPVTDLMGGINLEASTVCDLVFMDDSNPLTYQLTLRKREDSRNGSRFDYTEIP